MFDELLESNRSYCESFTLAGVSGRAAKGFALLTCMDSRIDPLGILGIAPGDAKFLRNAGARATTDVLRSLGLATHFLGVTEIAVMQHTQCAMAGVSDTELRARLPADGATAAAGWELLAMPDPDAALRQDVAAVRSCPLLARGVLVEGWRYDVTTGLIDRVIRHDQPAG